MTAAQKEFAANGFAGARTDAIARGARVNERMIFYCFQSKEGLYRAVLAKHLSAKAALIETLPDEDFASSMVRGFDECCADQFAKTTSHDKHQKEGACSPFFACATCPGFVQLTKPVQLADPIIEKTIHHQAMLKIDLTTYSCSFWQPPRSC